jgi:hypothetical protein
VLGFSQPDESKVLVEAPTEAGEDRLRAKSKQETLENDK